MILIHDDESLEFLIEHLKFMIHEQPDKKIEKISDLTDILSDFMSTFLVVVDALISSSQRRFGAIDQKLDEFEDFLLNASIKGLSDLADLSQATEKKRIEKKEQPIQETKPRAAKIPPKPSNDVVSPPTPTRRQIPTSESIDTPREIPVEMSEDMEVEDLAAFAFQQREKSPTPSTRPKPPRLGAVSLKMELMQELKKKFGTEKQQ